MKLALNYNQLQTYINSLYQDGELSEQDYNDIITYIITKNSNVISRKDLIQIRRGAEENLPFLAQGEMALTLDTEKVFIGGLTGAIHINSVKEENLIELRNDINDDIGDLSDNISGDILELSENINNYINVKKMGAVGDGVTDDRLSIQTSINKAVSEGKGEVYLPEGNYLLIKESGGEITEALTIPSNITFKGDGIGKTKLILQDNAPDWTRVVGIANNAENVTIENLSIDGKMQTLVGGGNEHMAGIFVKKGKNITIKNVEIKNTRGDSIQFYGGSEEPFLSNVYVDSCILGETGRNNITAEQVTNVFISNTIMENAEASCFDSEPFSNPTLMTNLTYFLSNNIMRNCNSDAFQVTGYAKFLFANNRLENIGGKAFYIRNAEGNLVNNFIENSQGVYIVGNSKNINLHDNVILGESYNDHCIIVLTSLGTPKNISIKNNLIENYGSPSYSAIQTKGGKDTKIEGNTFRNFLNGVSIDLNSQMDTLTIKNNLFIDLEKYGVEYWTSISERKITLFVEDNVFIGADTETSKTAFYFGSTTDYLPTIVNNYISNIERTTFFTGAGSNQKGYIIEKGLQGKNTILVNSGEPENNMVAEVGSWAKMWNGRLFYKKSDSNLATGWIEVVGFFTSPNGTKYKQTINDAGVLTISSL